MSDDQRPAERQRGGDGRLFALGDFWLGREAGRDQIYKYWYDVGTRRTRRKAIGTNDLEEAKVRLAKEVLAEPPKDPLDAGNVTIAAIRAYYWEHHASKIRSQNAARQAFALLLKFLRTQKIEGAPKLGHFGLAQQHSFAIWCRDTRALSSKSISTYLSTIKAACRFAAKPRMIRDGRGVEREVRLLAAAPYIADSEAEVVRVTGTPRSRPRQWLPEPHELAAIIDNIRPEDEQVFRYIIMALNTWARPEAICQLSVKSQVDFGRGLIHLNPDGRQQNNKFRPTIRLTDNLRGWLLHWNLDRPIVYNGAPVNTIDNRTLRRAARRGGVANTTALTKYTLRHYMATKVRAVPGIDVSREQRAEWLGHLDPEHNTTQGWYESMDADYLLAPALATDGVLAHLNTLTRRSLVAPGAVAGSRLVVVGNNQPPEAEGRAKTG